jgi:acyl-CoA reductase-like NAD-dependent aldehyde dehydrogenase
LASRPAASITPGLDVLVQLVMAAISTSPLPMVTWPAPPLAAAGAVALTWAEGLGRLVGHHLLEVARRAGRRRGGFAVSAAGRAAGAQLELVGRLVEAVGVVGLGEELRELGRHLAQVDAVLRALGPARLGDTVPRSSRTILE